MEQVYSDKEFSLDPMTVKETGNQIQVIGKGELQKQGIQLSAEFNKSADLLQIVAAFPQSKKMNKRSFKRFSKGPSLAEWFPKDILKNLKISSISFQFDPDNDDQKSSLKAMHLNVKSTSSWKFADSEQLLLRDITGALIIEDPKSKNNNSVQLAGNLNIGKSSFAVNAQRNKSGAD